MIEIDVDYWILTDVDTEITNANMTSTSEPVLVVLAYFPDLGPRR